MKKIGIINAPLARVVSALCHSDSLVVADAGLPIPKTVERIDLALKNGTPRFLETLEVVLSEMYIERAIIAKEMLDYSVRIHKGIQQLLKGIPVESVPHREFKELTRTAKAIIRTGEFTPYTNIILVAGPWGFEL
jgi:D-ribose pyranase